GGRLRLRIPLRQRLDVWPADGEAVLVAEQGFEEDLQREWQLPGSGGLRLDGGQLVKRVILGRDGHRAAGTGTGHRHERATWGAGGGVCWYCWQGGNQRQRRRKINEPQRHREHRGKKHREAETG